MDKIRHDPTTEHPDVPFEEKDNTLFWRGATSEGVSIDGTWKGMARQRLVHLASNHTSANRATILVPTNREGTGFAYQTVETAEMRSALDLDFGIVEKISRCGREDCQAQEQEFEFKDRFDFQDHWRYKYLFDLDGAGFSGRFLPFLQSHSLPFKTALFREWYDSRISAWLHFVPQDVRLHGVHSTLAYLSGFRGNVGGREVVMEAHEKEAEFIAEQGRQWASKVLRKEDMEIYFFRLLLEWGRLTDDRRDEIGFQM